MNNIKTSKVKWLNIKNPSKKDLDYLKKTYKLHPVILQELLTPTLRPKVEEYEGYLYMVLHFPVYDSVKQITTSIETDFVVLKNTLITVHYETLAPIKKFWTNCQINTQFRKHNFGDTTALLLYSILKTLYDFSSAQLEHINKKINQIENRMFKEKGSEQIVEKISLALRDILDFKKAIRPQQIILNSLKTRGEKFFSKKMTPYFTDILGDFIKVESALESHQETIKALSQTNDSLVSNRTNKIIRLLTIFSVIVFPLTLLASVFGMNTKYLPFVGHKYDFWIVFGIMIAATILMLVGFKRKKWL